MSEESQITLEKKEKLSKQKIFLQWLIEVSMVGLLLCVGAYLRLTGLDWDDDQNLHPDERFLTGVETALRPVDSFEEYWQTETSTMNPNNVGYTFFVYGTLPIFAVRYVAEYLPHLPQIIFGEIPVQTGWGEINLVGRQLSAAADLLVIVFVYLTARRVYNKKVALAAAVFSTFTVLQIQLSHFFAVDTFLNLFTLMAVYFAVRVATDDRESKIVKPGVGAEAELVYTRPVFSIWDFVFFGLALGMAMASKVNALPVAITLPLAIIVRFARSEVLRRKEGDIWHIIGRGFGYLALGAFLSIVAFRIFQPYAFTGPNFIPSFSEIPAAAAREAGHWYDAIINPAWKATMESLFAQSTGDVDWPPSLQWARRPVTFSVQNMVSFGMGWPMGLLAWFGFVWAGWKMVTEKKTWQTHIVIWAWVALYFTWQSSAFNPTMRYQLPIYPLLAIYAGWAFVSLWQWAGERDASEGWQNYLKPALRGVVSLAMLLTAMYAFAFVTIYQRPVTRVAATDWIYENIPGPLTLNIQTEAGETHQPLSFPYDHSIRPGYPYASQFVARHTGTLTGIGLKNILPAGEARTLYLTVYDSLGLETPLFQLPVDFKFNQDTGYGPQSISFVPSTPIILDPDLSYRVVIEISPGPSLFTLRGMELRTLTMEGLGKPISLYAGDFPMEQGQDLDVSFIIEEAASISEIFGTISPGSFDVANLQTLLLEFSDTPNFDPVLAVSKITINLEDETHPAFEFETPVAMLEATSYYYRITNQTVAGGVSLLGTAITHETSWDDGLPLRHDGYDGYGGIYPRDFNFDLYADDSVGKRMMMLELMEEAEYITISSSRVWGSAVQVPERYAMTIEYYRWLLGCPEGRDLEWCYNVADVGMFEGQLGFELIQVFQSDPTLGPFSVNDQFAEEAFTVYDHPKVFIFQKTDAYDHAQVTEKLESVDLSCVFHVTPKQAGKIECADLLLPEGQLDAQRAGGTWSELFDVDNFINSSQPMTVIVWYLAVSVLGVGVYPLLRRVMGGLDDKGYPMARASGMLLLAYLSWLAGSVGLGYERWLIALFYFLLMAAGIAMAIKQWDEIKVELREKGSYFLLIEAVFLIFFLAFLFVRLGNPDLWHPYKGGEKPMDFSYFNAVLKSSSFPPYDPWFSGGYLNYYYYGFVFAGTMVKMLGIVPAVAYNLILPTLFAMLSLGAFSISWNLFVSATGKDTEIVEADVEDEKPPKKKGWLRWIVGLAGALGVAVLGNLGTMRMFIQGFQKLGAYGVYAEDAGFISKLNWTFRGIGELLNGNKLPYGLGDWYWIPSRAIAAPNETQPITEFPWFTMIYADPHAHMFALVISIIVIGWVVALLLGKAWKGQSLWTVGGGVLFGALAIGALNGTNTWDYPTYLALGVVVLGYAVFRFRDLELLKALAEKPPEKEEGGRKRGLVGLLSPIMDNDILRFVLRGGVAVFFAGVLAVLTRLLYAPYNTWNVTGYTNIITWEGTHTPLNDYLIHWGLFLFIIFFWLGWETIDWMAKTPASSLRKFMNLEMVSIGVLALLAGLGVMLILQVSYDVRIHWLALLLAAWAALLLFRPNQPEAKRLMLFFIGTGLFLTVMVEVKVLSGDIARMNTVFKFYLQVWVMLGVTSAVGMGILWKNLERWTFSWQVIWQLGFAILASSAALFPMIATSAKIQDRMSTEAPNTLDGMAYMQTSFYYDKDVNMELLQDYEAIRWLQQNVIGSPVIVEGHTGEYRWGNRITIYTGLPSVLGWRHHQNQQRIPGPDDWIPTRADAIVDFYLTTDGQEALDFLATYDVSYIIVGQLERAYYPGPGMDKFEIFDGVYWQAVYEDGDTVIYQVIVDEE